MIFIGFAYLMTFIKANSLTALAFNWIISVWALQWAIIWSGLWGNWIHGGTNIQLDLAKMIVADFGAGTVMITYGAVLGKCTLIQMLFLATAEMFFWAMNESICVYKIGATDMGGSMFVHTFGAYFGVAACYFF